MSPDAVAQKIAERAKPYGVAPARHVAEALARYLELLGRWNRTINLTALPLDPPSDSAIDRLIVEALVAAAHLPAGVGRLLDIGSGSGSPAIPIKVARPELELTMVESRHRKSAFLREAARALSLTGVSTVTAEFGSAVLSDRTFGIVTMRAVVMSERLGAAIGHITETGGRLVLFLRDSSSPGPSGWTIEHTAPSPGGFVRVLRKDSDLVS